MLINITLLMRAMFRFQIALVHQVNTVHNPTVGIQRAWRTTRVHIPPDVVEGAKAEALAKRDAIRASFMVEVLYSERR